MRQVLAAAFWAAFFMPAAASAVPLSCVSRDQIFDSLLKSHGEVPAFRGVTSAGAMLEVLVGPDGTFTVFVTFPDGLTCPLATGEGWRDVPRTSIDPAA